MKEALRLAAAGGPGPHYGDGSTYGGGKRYYVADASEPQPLGDKVRLDLSRRGDNALKAFALDHITKMAGNANYPTPLPSVAAFLAVYTEYDEALAGCEAAKNAQKAATALKDEKRANLELFLDQRGDYVQIASNGNGPVILTSGFDVKSSPTPIGPLGPPINLRIDLNGIPGVMKLRWDAVENARGYLVECSEDVTPRVWSQIKNTSKTYLLLENMVVGKVYVFRIATQGGSTGQSPWSAEVIRGAA